LDARACYGTDASAILRSAAARFRFVARGVDAHDIAIVKCDAITSSFSVARIEKCSDLPPSICGGLARFFADAAVKDPIDAPEVVCDKKTRGVATAAVRYCSDAAAIIFRGVRAGVESVTPPDDQVDIGFVTSVVSHASYIIHTKFAREFDTRIYPDAATSIAGRFAGVITASDDAIFAHDGIPGAFSSETPAVVGSFLFAVQNAYVERSLVRCRDGDIQIM